MTKDSSLKKIYGLIGYPVKHSFSPAMHNAAFKYLNIDAEYRLFEVKPEELKDFLLNKDFVAKDREGNSIHARDIVGFNITIPHKVRVLELARLVENVTVRVYPEVLLSGAVNTIKRDNGKLHYLNTDTIGFVKSLIEDLKFNPEDKNVLLFGCGGAGRAIIAGLTPQEGFKVKKIYIYDANKEATNSAENHFSALASNFGSLRNKLQFISIEGIPKVIPACQLLVNASPVGMKEGDGSVIDKNLLHQSLYIYDVVYNRKTQLIRDAESLGLHAKDGLGMLLYQGVSAFEFWTGRKVPVEVMRKALVEAVSK